MSRLKALSDQSRMQQDATECRREKMDGILLKHIAFSCDSLSQKQLNAVTLLLQGLSNTEVAQQLGVDRATIFRWQKKKIFAVKLAEQRQMLWQQSLGRLQSMLEPALDILQRQITGEDPRTALRAASILLRIATPARLERLTNPDAQSRQTSPQVDREMEEMEAYINAPMPGEPGHPATKGLAEEEEI